MLEIDQIIDNKPKPELVAELAELRIRNLQAFSELQEFNNQGKFIYKHPLIVHYSLRNKLKKMLQRNSKMFLEEYSNCRDNIKRYKSYINNSKRDDEKKKKDKLNLRRYKEKLQLMEELMNEHKE